MNAQLVCIGEPLVEFNQIGNSLDFRQGFGGDTSNVAIAAARQGASCAYFSHLGSDIFGAKIREMWSAEGIDHSNVREVSNAPTGVYFVTHDESGHVFNYLRTGSAASKVTGRDIPEDLIAGATILHFSAISQAISRSACEACISAVNLAKTNGVKISFDTNLRLSLWPIDEARSTILNTLKMVDILLPSLDDAKILTDLNDENSIIDYFLERDVGIVAMTMGGKGVIVANSSRREVIEPELVEVVDATGAGDAFDGSFLSEILAGRDIFAAAKYANVAAALSTGGFGAVSPLPTREQVENYLSNS